MQFQCGRYFGLRETRQLESAEAEKRGALCSVLLTTYYSVGQIWKNEMVGACSIYEG